jgi:uncharacterized protein (DUF983 family)
MSENLEGFNGLCPNCGHRQEFEEPKMNKRKKIICPNCKLEITITNSANNISISPESSELINEDINFL